MIRVRGARTHNLKNVNVDLPHHELVVITGLSGSGKSSLAFDTLYAEGQRRYVESLSAYARQFLQLMEKPDVDLIEGLSPAISIEQKATSHNPRSTVGTVTEIHDYMRLLFARAGTPRCPHHGIELAAQTVSQMVDAVLLLPEDTKLMVLAPLVVGRKGEQLGLIDELRAQGFVRLRVDGEVFDIDAVPALEKNRKHTIEAVVDRLKIRPDMKQRLAESFETALRHSDGKALAVLMDADPLDSGREMLFSAKFACPVCDYALPELEPRLFSFNNPMGACPKCDGLGSITFFDPERVVAFPHLSLASGAIKGWDRRNAFFYRMLESLAMHYGFDIDTPWEELPEAIRHIILHGSGRDEIAFQYIGEGGRKTTRKHRFDGVIPSLERRYKESESQLMREELAKFIATRPCPECGGSRLRIEARHVTIGGATLHQLSHLPIRQTLKFFDELKLTGHRAQVAEKIIKEIRSRLTFLNNVGLDYLSLERSADTLSGGEAQRIRLASQIGSGLTGVMYVLDEPSIGLHQRDNTRLLESLKGLRDLGNSVLVVEHDEEAILTADYVIDMGPAAGVHGGEVVSQGKPADIMADPKSLTGQYLSGAREIEVPEDRRPISKKKVLRVVGATGNNLKNVTGEIPVGTFTCITGVSGGGKSTFTIETLYKAAARRLHNASDAPSPHERIEGLEHFDKVIDIDQSPIGRTPRSNPATYTGAFQPIRDWFAGLPEAKARGYGPGRFSFNVKGGRCEACQGDGLIKIEMHFLPDVYVTCDVCHGKRYNRETLEILFKGKSISDVLEMTVDEAHDFFKAVPSVREKMATLQRVGLGYVKVGQQATTLSGGEAQRVKLSKELSRRATGKTLYILDEPTTGLHFEDVKKLLEVLHELADQGNTVVVIEHNLDVIKTADWLVDFGPEGGDGGGEIVGVGSPEQLAANPRSWTGRYLAELLDRHTQRKTERRRKLVSA